MAKDRLKVQKSSLLNFLEGHKKADELIRLERKRRLSQMASEDSLREYDALCKIWEESTQKEGLERLDRRKIRFLIEMRKRFNKVGGSE